MITSHLSLINYSTEIYPEKSKQMPIWKEVIQSVMSSLKTGATKLSHRHVRALIKKEKRKLKRQLEANSKEKQDRCQADLLPQSDTHAEEDREQTILDEYLEREKKRLHYLWLQREEEAATDFKEKYELEVRSKLEKDEHIRKLNAELTKLDDCLEVQLHNEEDTGPWHNPMAPKNYLAGIVMERKKCLFFSKTGACRFGERCSRSHERPSISCTILIHNMFSHFSLDQAFRDEYDTDLTLEYEDSDTYQQFKEFYDDVLPEFQKLGNVVQFKVCCNQEPHLRGNVYVQFSSEIEATEAFKMFNGRWYASRQLTCEFSPVTEWKMAICGLFHSKRCPKGRTCNFLHVFRNPTNEFWAADKGIMESQATLQSTRRSCSKSSVYMSNVRNFFTSNRYQQSKRSRKYRSPDFSKRLKKSKYSSSHSIKSLSRHKHIYSKRSRLSEEKSRSKSVKCHKGKISRTSESSTSSSERSGSESPDYSNKPPRKSHRRTPKRSRKSRSKSPKKSRGKCKS